MKKWVAFLLSLIMLVLFVGCSNKLEKPETNLEFWIAENVDDVDFSAYHEKSQIGYMGNVRLYYGSGYQPTIDEDGMQVEPEVYVLYAVAPYPDHTSRKKHITGITIHDPSVVVYGLTVNASDEEIKVTMANNGFDGVEIGNSGDIEWVKDKYHVSFLDGSIYINVEVSNFWNIQF